MADMNARNACSCRWTQQRWQLAGWRKRLLLSYCYTITALHWLKPPEFALPSGEWVLVSIPHSQSCQDLLLSFLRNWSRFHSDNATPVQLARPQMPFTVTMTISKNNGKPTEQIVTNKQWWYIHTLTNFAQLRISCTHISIYRTRNAEGQCLCGIFRNTKMKPPFENTLQWYCNNTRNSLVELLH